MPELVTLFETTTTAAYVPTEVGEHHNNSNVINIYSVSHINGNATSVYTKPATQTVLTTSGQHFSSTHSLTSTQPRQFYIKKTFSSRSSNIMGQFESKQANDAKLNLLFDQYKDANEDLILADGIERLCEDLQVNPDEFRVLVSLPIIPCKITYYLIICYF